MVLSSMHGTDCLCILSATQPDLSKVEAVKDQLPVTRGDTANSALESQSWKQKALRAPFRDSLAQSCGLHC